MKNNLFSLTKKDFEVQHFKGSGPGGQSRNKNATAVRIIHKDSGSIGESQEMKSQIQNKKLAFERLIKSDKFQIWLKKKIARENMGQEIEKFVDKWTESHYIKVEGKDEKGNWKRIS